ncbi:MAG: hypothetical protein JO346_13235 [Alphaproteobacteria bacterium]|nr:hypothetical protein [Alphaproteobacteria bacterium]
MPNGKEVWFVQRTSFPPQTYPVHWKGFALWLAAFAAIGAWMTFAVRTGIIADRTWLFALVPAVLGVVMMYFASEHTERR